MVSHEMVFEHGRTDFIWGILASLINLALVYTPPLLCSYALCTWRLILAMFIWKTRDQINGKKLESSIYIQAP